MREEIVVTTWSHSSYSDIWKMYYGQFQEHAPYCKHYMMVNKINDDFPENCVPIINDENEKFSKRLVSSLKQVESDNIIYMQEDFVLYADVKKDYLIKVKNFLNNSNYSFIRLMKSGVEGGQLINEELNIYEIPSNCQYLYCLQAAMWKKNDLIRLFDFYKPIKNKVRRSFW